MFIGRVGARVYVPQTLCLKHNQALNALVLFAQIGESINIKLALMQF